MATDSTAKSQGSVRTYVRDIRSSFVRFQYPAWVRNNRLKARDMARLREEAAGFEYRPPVSFIMAVRDPRPERLKRALDSMLSQVYPGWELRICSSSATGPVRDVLARYERLDGRIRVERAEPTAGEPEMLNSAISGAAGEFAGILGQEDELAPDALFEVVRLLQENPAADLIYTDEDQLDDGGERFAPVFKPDFSPDLLMCHNYVGRLCIYRRSLLGEVGGFRPELDGAHEYDLLLRVTERTENIYHLPRVLYHRRVHRRDSGRAQKSSGRVLSEALERRRIRGTVEPGPRPATFRVRYEIRQTPKISIVIPTRDNAALLRRCVESIERLTTYPNYEIAIVDNDSRDPQTLGYLASTPHKVLEFREKFNYSRINNFAVSHTDGEHILFLNDDTEVISPGWLEAMLEHAQRPEIGAAGAKLIYPDGRIQHAGVLLGAGSVWMPGIATHSHQYYPVTSSGYGGALEQVRNYSAVTAACMMLRRAVFEEVGGFEESLRTSFNDVDLCLKIRERGYRIVYTPYAELYHYESASRGYVNSSEGALYIRERWGAALDEDPYYNLNFSLGGGDFNLRADMLRPQILRPESTQEDVKSWKDPWKMSNEELRRYVSKQRANARNSRRTTLIPAANRYMPPPPVRKAARVGGRGKNLLSRLFPRFRRGPALASGRESHLSEEQFVWIFGSPRTGSTWLSRIVQEQPDQSLWFEPYVGALFGQFYERLKNDERLLNSRPFILGEPYREEWLRAIRTFILDGAEVRFPKLKRDQFLFVKEPNGSIGAPLIMESMPNSRLVFLIRDSRDVVASRLDAMREGSWSRSNQDYSTPKKLKAATRRMAEQYRQVVSLVKEAYDKHPGRKALVRYEDLRRDTFGTLKAMYRDLGIAVDDERLQVAIEKHSWERIPPEEKGTGKFFRKGCIGGWKEDLSDEQVRIIEEVTGHLLSEFYGPAEAAPMRSR
ncbi:glycosyltransferase [Rubrobacter taiwanensis]|uniref:Glycosyltransferase n=1 Tax=Rubrobacter taiwanensis TaxID=185139 RepID=A0A4R1BS97_9ACTN|nr:glycosyltransferase [Rubrobacter taiwanensis]TCJ20693.1 glycosyltransferase [Rubrobacter taiwanensis]